jgi:hypothetical protein
MITGKDRDESEIIYNLCVQIEAGLLVYDDLPKMVSRIRSESAEQVTKEARELIKEMSQTLLTISQYPIAFVCEDVRTLARNEWKKSKEYV